MTEIPLNEKLQKYICCIILNKDENYNVLTVILWILGLSIIFKLFGTLLEFLCFQIIYSKTNEFFN